MWLNEDYNTVDFFTVNKDTMQIAYTVLLSFMQIKKDH